MKNGHELYISELSSIIPISIQVSIPDLVFPVYKIDREQSEKTFLRNVWRYQRSRTRSLWELSKGLNIFYEKGPLYCISYHSVMKLSRVKTGFFLSEITRPLAVARTSDSSNTFWQSLRVRAREVLLYIKLIKYTKHHINKNIETTICSYNHLTLWCLLPIKNI